MKTSSYEAVNASWPYPGFRRLKNAFSASLRRPSGLSCDAKGSRVLVTDGLSTFIARVHEEVEEPDQGMRPAHISKVNID